MKQNLFNVAVIADIHFGAIRPEQLYTELKESFLDFIKDKYLDMIVIAGDFFNSIISLNSQSALKAFKFMRELVEICEKNEIKYVRIIEGTLSHDNLQILNFQNYESNKKVDFKVITTVREESLSNGLNILYFPEEYMEDPISYYKDYICKPSKYYDFIFGHGMFKETSFVKDDSESMISKAPIWDSKFLSSICRGPIFFGHIHTSQIIRKHIYYTGSFSRWVYGQEEDKGFYIFTYHMETGKYLTEFIVNKLARRFDTTKVFLEKALETQTIDELIKRLKLFKVDNLRIQVLVEALQKDYSLPISIMKEYFTGKPGYKFELIDLREKAQHQQMEEKINKLSSDYEFLFDDNLPVQTKIHKFIKRKYEKDVSEEKIMNLLNINEEK